MQRKDAKGIPLLQRKLGARTLLGTKGDTGPRAVLKTTVVRLVMCEMLSLTAPRTNKGTVNTKKITKWLRSNMINRSSSSLHL